MTTLEIACFNEPSARIAAYGGADRIELCENYAEGGLTPQAETLRRLKTHVRIPIFVMIRPRGGSFQYTKCEFKEMQTQLLDLKSLGADGFVFGILSSEGKVDIEKNKVLVQLAGGLPCTFHRGFDQVYDQGKALEAIIECGFSHLLTSGGASSALEGLERLRCMQTEIGEKLNILVGGGVRSSNVGRLKKYFRAIHSACITDGTEYIDAEELKALKTLITNPVL